MYGIILVKALDNQESSYRSEKHPALLEPYVILNHNTNHLLC